MVKSRVKYNKFKVGDTIFSKISNKFLTADRNYKVLDIISASPIVSKKMEDIKVVIIDDTNYISIHNTDKFETNKDRRIKKLKRLKSINS